VTRLKPKVIETFDTIAGAYKRLRRLQHQDIQFQLKRLSLSPAQERTYKKLKNEIIGEVKSLRLNQARIDALVEQLYDISIRSLWKAAARCLIGSRQPEASFAGLPI
jgi:RNA polymerase primary sigma factor